MRIKKTSGTAILTGNIINSLESDSQFNAPSIEAVNKKTNGIVLYENASGTISNITLSQTSANFKFIEIYYFNVSNNGCCSVKVDNPNGKTIIAQSNNFLTANNRTYYKYLELNVSNETITIVRNNTVEFGIGNVAATNELKIYKVIGYE